MENIILVGLQSQGKTKRELFDSLAELQRLAETAGMAPELSIIQKKDRPDPAFLIGTGKARELKEIILEKNIQTVVFDDDLKPFQQRNLEELLGINVIDRTRLILDIFAARARSREGKLQVERARLAYMSTRLAKKGVYLDSQSGGIGTRRGPGEKKLEVDQRAIRDRLAELDDEIDEIRAKRRVLRHNRSETEQPTVAIAGYTNAGKSTLLNYLSMKNDIYSDDLLFATLDPTTRKVTMPSGRTVLITDTVGFINKLPHTLVAAFRATMEEITSANCILHLVDASHPAHREQTATVSSVLKDLDLAANIPVVTAYNKMDMVDASTKKRMQRHGAICISAKTGEGISALLKKIEETVTPKLIRRRFSIPYDKSNVLSKIYGLSVVKNVEYRSGSIVVNIESAPQNLKRLLSLLKESRKA